MGALANWMNPVVAGDLYSTLQNGTGHLRSYWDTFAMFGGVLCVIAGVIFVVLAVMKQRDKAKWWWSAAIAFMVGAILLVAKSTEMIQGDFSDTWAKTFGMIDLLPHVGSLMMLPPLF